MEPYEKNGQAEGLSAEKEEGSVPGLSPMDEINDRAQRDYDDKFKKYTDALERGNMEEAKSILPSLRVAARYRNHMKAEDNTER